MPTLSFLDFLPQLQAGQLRHDTVAHQDILHLILPRRLTHFTLHLAKYQAGLHGSLIPAASPTRQRLITDSMIIVLAAANGMKVDLRARISQSSTGSVFEANRTRTSTSLTDLVNGYIQSVGRMAKACEALDHLEDFPVRQVLELSVIELALTVGAISQVDGLDLKASVEKRWYEIEQELAKLQTEAPANVRQLARA
jgi:hypothetical protein